MTTGTTTTINWAWGKNSVLAFNPATDVLDFGWFQADQFTVTEVNGSVVISIPSNNETYTLQGVKLSQLTMANITAKDSSALAEWTAALATGGTGTGTGSGGTGSGGTETGGTETGGTGSGGTGTGHVGDGAATVTTITWAWGTNTALNFDTALDKLDFGWFSADNFTVSEVAGSVVISIPSNNQTYTLTGVKLTDLSLANIIAKDGSAVSEWTDALSGTTGSGGTGTGGTGTGGTGSGGTGDSGTGGTGTGGTGTGGTGTGGTTIYADPWSATKVYNAGDFASENGIVYKASWWTQGSDPATNHGTEGSGEVWIFAGYLDSTPVVPNAPEDLFAASTTDTSTVLVWDAATVSGVGTVTGYGIYMNGVLIATTTDTHYKVADLDASTGYDFTVVAIDEAGTSAATSPIHVTTGLAGSSDDLDQVFAPYIDMSLSTSQDLLAIAKNSGVLDFTLAFMLSSGTDQVGWQGTGTIENDTLWNGTTMLSQIEAIQAAGGNITISFGGANGQEAALTATSAAKLTAEYQSVIDRYHVNSLDFDIEGAAVTNRAANHLRDQALVALDQANPDLTISFTLPVLPTGLTQDGINLLKQAAADGVHIDVVNIMAMDYGASVDSGDMGKDAISAAIATLAQLKEIGIDAKLGITPMIGINDVSSEVFTLQDAQELLDYADGNPEIARLAMWSLGRDNGSTVGVVSPLGSGVEQTAYEFSHIFGNF